MKTLFENIFNKEKFVYDDTEFRGVEVIDGVEFLRVRRQNSTKVVLMKRESLVKLEDLPA